jgi:integrase
VRTLNRLSTTKVARLKHKGMYADGGGLYLRVSESGTKGWIFRFGENGKLHDMGLGAVHTISLAKARERARECRELRLQGINPISHRRASLAARKASEARAMTFRQCAEAYMASHEDAWRNARHREQWRSSLAAYVYPVIGELPVNAVDTGLVLKVVEPIWKTTTETASRIRGRIERVLGWATVREYRSGDNPARWRGHLQELLPAKGKVRKVEHYAALPYTEIGAFMAMLRQHSNIAARALEYTILTATRTGEALGTKWSEIDLSSGTWTIPAERIKTGKEHKVPLSGAAIAVLEGMQSIRHSEFVFPGAQPRRPLSGMAMAMALRRLGRDDLTVHGFRSTFRDWAAERTSFPREVAEMALAHAIPSAVEAAYRRGDLFDKRRRLMDAWAEYCGKQNGAGAVVPMGGRHDPAQGNLGKHPRF